MARLKTLPSRIGKPAVRVAPLTVADTTRMTGRRLQERRKRLWADNPHCKKCGRVVPYPHGFELDHIVPLFKGGQDTDENCQLLCIDGSRGSGCHHVKTIEDLRRS